MKRYFIYIFFLSLFIGCYSSKKTVSNQQINALKKAVEETGFIINSDAANPVAFANTRGIENLLPPGSNLNRISLSSNANKFSGKKDSIDLNLPFYGEKQMGGGYASDGGFTFNGSAESVDKEFKANKNKYKIDYRIKTDSESLTINVVLFENKSSVITINSSIRTTIIYYGKWKAIEKE